LLSTFCGEFISLFKAWVTELIPIYKSFKTSGLVLFLLVVELNSFKGDSILIIYIQKYYDKN